MSNSVIIKYVDCHNFKTYNTTSIGNLINPLLLLNINIIILKHPTICKYG